MFNLKCLVLGHDPLTERDGPAMYQRCQRCLRRTAGWLVERKPLVFTKAEPKAAAPAPAVILIPAPATKMTDMDLEVAAYYGADTRRMQALHQARKSN